MSFRVRPHVVLLWVLGGVLALLGVMLAVPAYAAVVGEWRVVLLRGSTTQATITGATEQEAWDSCVRRIAAQPPSSSTWTCQTPRYVARVVADPEPVCDPLPVSVTETRQCPDGTVGTWLQTQAYIREPYPLCQSTGPWVPVEPPSGACTVPPPPPPTGEWIECATQGQRCEFTGTRRVRYGIDTRWIERDATDGITCDSTSFGGNPASGALKTCQLRGSAEPPPTDPPPPTGTGTALLNWMAPAQNTDDTPATLTGFRVRYGRSADSLNQVVEAGPVTTYTVTALASGTWYFGVAALSASGESEQSNVATKVVP